MVIITVLIIALVLTVAYLAAMVRALATLTKDMAELQLRGANQHGEWVKLTSEIHGAIFERLKLIEARLPAQEWKNTYPPVYGPIPVTCEPTGMDYAETKAWDEAADEALRNFEKQVGE